MSLWSGKSDPDPPPPYQRTERAERTPLLPKRRQDEEYREENRRSPRITRACILGLLLLLVLAFVYSVVYITEKYEEPPRTKVKVAVIGAGPAGISAAFELGKIVEERGLGVDIVVFEEKGRIGGRMVLDDEEVHVEDVMSGGLMESLREVIRESGNQKWMKMKAEKRVEDVGFININKIVEKIKRPYSSIPYGTWLRLIFKYGRSIWLAPKIPTGTMSTYTHHLLDSKTSFTSTQSMLQALSNHAYSMTATERLRKNGVDRKYTHEILAPQIRRHIGQEIGEISDLALSMALQREKQQLPKEVWGVYEEIMNAILANSGAKLRSSTRVIGLRREFVDEDVEKWILRYETLENGIEGYEIFDKIILATPYNSSSENIKIQSEIPKKNSSSIKAHLQIRTSTEEDEIIYRDLHITFLTIDTPLSASHLHAKGQLPMEVLPIDGLGLGITEISLLRRGTLPPRNAGEKVRYKYWYRILSEGALGMGDFLEAFGVMDVDGEGELERGGEKLGMDVDVDGKKEVEEQGKAKKEEITWKQHHIPNAYPLMYARNMMDMQQGKGEFNLGDGIWRTNVVEGVLGSAVGLSWVVGRNVGRGLGEEIVNEKGSGVR